MSHQGLSGTSVGPHTTFLLASQDPITVGVKLVMEPFEISVGERCCTFARPGRDDRKLYSNS